MADLSESGQTGISGISKLSKEDLSVFMAEFIRQSTESNTKREMHEEMKAVFREAISDFLRDIFADFGKWSVYGIAAAALGALCYFILHMAGWRLIK